MKLTLPAHIGFGQRLNDILAADHGQQSKCGYQPKRRFNLSQSGAKTLSYQQLMEMANCSQKQRINQLELGYASIQGDIALRTAIAQFHTELNNSYYDAEIDVANINSQSGDNQINPDQVITFAGAQEGLQALYQHVLTPEDEVITLTPSYPSLVAMASQLGATVKSYPLSFGNAWQLDLTEFAKLFSARTKLVVINSPHNPTGAALSQAQVAQILELAAAHNSYLLMDDVSQASNYREQALGHQILNYEKGVVVSVMSKSLGLGGLRIGWLVTKNSALHQGLLAQKCYSSICTSIVDEQLALVALSNWQQLVRQNNQIIADNIAAFQQLVNEFPGLLSWHQPQAGIMTLVKVADHIVEPFEDGQSSAMENWAIDCALKSGVTVLPSGLFGLSGYYFRLGLGQTDFNDALVPFRDHLSTFD
ncbi:pyridoxal phosphate-dependent aminotransferase [Endozoicomonas sp. G2_1]|uniref:pyridoxal phosphate-dependent aminotransferase n=1 Tax=Endozoicomonas sp. G2_1 TaxID=2821091 RepID=UPI001ADC3FC5|nr:pyridoxal phosphate-dependent aminotransferase [Endozoicomonas sp. G2_1]MBO9489383.1 pyridoxal phosphate-dependent aminotransferase [Endozoicomonas sp. G2_1]